MRRQRRDHFGNPDIVRAVIGLREPLPACHNLLRNVIVVLRDLRVRVKVQVLSDILDAEQCGPLERVLVEQEVANNFVTSFPWRLDDCLTVNKRV